MKNKTKGGAGSTSPASAGSRQRVSIEISSDKTGWDVDFKLTFHPAPHPNDPPRNGAVAAALRIMEAMAEHE
jgi:hypothetical protein